VATFRSRAVRLMKSSVNVGFALKYEGDAGTTRNVWRFVLPFPLLSPPWVTKLIGGAAINFSGLLLISSECRRVDVERQRREDWKSLCPCPIVR